MGTKRSQSSAGGLAVGRSNALYVGVILAVFFAAVGVIFFSNERFSRDMASYLFFPHGLTDRGSRVVRLTLDFGGGRRRAFEGALSSPITAGEALRFSREAGDFSASFALAGEVLEIDGVSSGEEKRWRWYLNGHPEVRPMLDVLVRGGDKILMKYE